MALSWLITYENEGKKGNDFSVIPPYDWLFKYREKLPNVVLLNWVQDNVPMGQLPRYNELISIENDYAEVFKEPEPEPVISGEDPIEENIESLPEEPVVEQSISRETVEHEIDTTESNQGIVSLPDNEEDAPEEVELNTSEMVKKLKDSGILEHEGRKIAINMGKEKIKEIYNLSFGG
jgi:hypothetical protein